MTPGDVVGHEPMGIVEEVGPTVGDLKVGDRVVVPFNLSCGHCWMCDQQLYSQCETTQNHESRHRCESPRLQRASTARSRAGRPSTSGCQYADFMPIKVPEGPPDDRFLFLSDVLPTAWQAVQYRRRPGGGRLLVMGLGPIGDMAARVGLHLGYRVIGVDLVPERLARVGGGGAEVIDLNAVDDVGDAVRELTDGRGADSVIDAVGMEAHGNPTAAGDADARRVPAQRSWRSR